VQLERVAVLGGVRAVGTAIAVDAGVRLGVAVEHRAIDAGVVAARAAERLGADVVAQVVLEVVAELGDERAARARQLALTPDMNPHVLPELLLRARTRHHCSVHVT